ncbi:Hypothetical protein SmN45_2517 [Serratia marcescens]|nr:Hypothetical protein SmN45_2517 [Serratia marcescens]
MKDNNVCIANRVTRPKEMSRYNKSPYKVICHNKKTACFIFPN